MCFRLWRQRVSGRVSKHARIKAMRDNAPRP
ncbi:MAG TPA: hypothetical protein DIV98_13055 [Oceanicaulis sp.]|nr:hypothetical protein [Oceanicaulis sp.]